MRVNVNTVLAWRHAGSSPPARRDRPPARGLRARRWPLGRPSPARIWCCRSSGRPRCATRPGLPVDRLGRSINHVDRRPGATPPPWWWTSARHLLQPAALGRLDGGGAGQIQPSRATPFLQRRRSAIRTAIRRTEPPTPAARSETARSRVRIGASTRRRDPEPAAPLRTEPIDPHAAKDFQESPNVRRLGWRWRRCRCLPSHRSRGPTRRPDALIKRLSTDECSTIKADKSPSAAGDVQRSWRWSTAQIMPNVNFQRMTASAVGPRLAAGHARAAEAPAGRVQDPAGAHLPGAWPGERPDHRRQAARAPTTRKWWSAPSPWGAATRSSSTTGSRRRPARAAAGRSTT